MSKRYKRLLSVIISIVLLAGIATALGAVDIFSLKNSEQAAMASDSDTIILRVCNWEEYIDTGDWDEAIELEDLLQESARREEEKQDMELGRNAG